MSFSLLTQASAITGKAPLWDERRACLWWVDIQAQRLLRTDESGGTSAYFTPSQPAMLALAESGRLVVGLEDGLWLFEPDNQTWTHILEVENDRPTVRLNDGKVDPFGRLWFGSMDITGTGQAIGRLYRFDPDGQLHTLREGIRTPNAIVPAADGSGLWFTDSPTCQLQFLHFHPETKSIAHQQNVLKLPAHLQPDGACEDEHGCLWLATVGDGAVLRISREGVIMERHDAPASRLTMVALGGSARNRLFVTSQRRFLSAQAVSEQSGASGILVKLVTAKPATQSVVPGF